MKTVTNILALACLSLTLNTAAACNPEKRSAAFDKNKCSVPTGRYIVSGNLGESGRYSATLWVTGCQVSMVIEDSTKARNIGDYLVTRNSLNRKHGPQHPDARMHSKKGKHQHKHNHGKHKGHRGGHPGRAKLCKGNSISFAIGKDRMAVANPSDLIGEVELKYVEDETNEGNGYLTGSIKLGEEFSILNDSTVDLLKQ
jgi:hypothetical protein